MKKADLLAGLALLGFEEVEEHAGKPGSGRYKYARWAYSQRVWREGKAPVLMSNVPEHLMVDIYYSVIAEAFYSCSSEGGIKYTSRNAENVWKWIQEQLYLDQGNTGLRPKSSAH